MRDAAQQSWYRQVKEQIRGYLFNNFPLKALAALIVAALWLSVAGQNRLRREVVIQKLDVLLVNAPPQLTITSTEPQQVNVHVKGPDDVIRDLRLAATMGASDMVPTADLGGKTEEGTYRIPLRIEGVPDGILMSKVDPGFVRVTLEPIRTREVPVEASFAGQLPPGYKLVGWQVTPSTLTLRGAQSRIQEVSTLRTTTVNLNGRTSTFVESVEVDITDVDVVPVGPTQVALRVVIEPEIGERTIENVPITIDGQPEAAPTPATVDVTVRGPVAVIETFSGANVAATITPEDSPTVRTYAPHVTLTGPGIENVAVSKISPTTVRMQR